MVLQRAPQAAIVWGFANPGATVKTTFNGATYQTTAGTDTIWRQALPPTPAGGPYTVSFSASTGEAGELVDVLFGDVFLCSGQSNMQFSIPGVTNATYEANLANKYPDIRIFSVGQGTQSNVPLTKLGSIQEAWSVANNMSVAFDSNNAFGYFSAVCWLFGRDVHDGLGGKVPVGLISSNWGGTPIEDWAPPPAYPPCNRTAGTPTLWNAMINPFAVGPMALTGFTWYQGEANTGSQASADAYACLFPSMISSWRQAFASPNAFFGFIQLSTWCIGTDGSAIPEMRQAQMAALSLPYVGYGVNADHGAGCNIHPPPKQFCSARMANSALALSYGLPVIWKSPSYVSASDSGTGVVTVTLKDVPPGGLVLQPSANVGTINCTASPGQCGWAAIQFDDPGGSPVNATVSVSADGQQVVLQALPPAGATKAVGTSYGWAAVPFETVYTAGHDLPVLAWNEPL